MLTVSFRHYLFRSHSLAIFLNSILLFIVFTLYVQHFIQSKAKTDLQHTLVYVQEMIKTAPEHANISSYISQLGTLTQTRLTLIGPEGAVMADSHEDTTTVNSLLTRSEIQALDNAIGQPLTRFSDTLQLPMMYQSVLFQAPQWPDKVYLRLAIPIQQLTSLKKNILALFLLSLALSIPITLLIIWLTSRSISHSLRAISTAAHRFSSDEPASLNAHSSIQEFQDLGQSLHQMSHLLTTRLHTISHQKQHLNAIVKHSTMGMIIIDNRHDITLINPAAISLFQLQLPLINQAYSSLSFPSEIISFLDKNLTHETLRQQDIQVESSLPLFLNCILIPIEATRVQHLLLIVDFTQIHTLEHTRKSFIANLSHELKTPISIIQNAVETLHFRHPDMHTNDTSFLSTIFRHISRINHVINDLTLLSRLECEPSHFHQQFQSLLLTKIIEKSIQTYLKDAQKKQIRIEFQYSQYPSRITAHPELVERAISELLKNAITFSPSESLIRITCIQQHNSIDIEIHDQGIGIDPHHFNALYLRFYRIEPDRNRNQGGSGLGLAIVKHISKVLHGHIHVSSQMGLGSVFTLSLPKFSSSPTQPQASSLSQLTPVVT